MVDADDIELPTTTLAGSSRVCGPKAEAMVEFERNYLLNLLAEHKGNVSRAALAAGRDRRTFQRLLRKHAIDRTAFQNLV
jgi:DNA-binding NtrC family response regulator